MDDKEYEAITAALYQALGEGSGIMIEGYGASCRVEGKSGSWYQIDVLTKQSNGLQTVRTAIECKYWNRRVPRTVVSHLVTTLEDTNIEKGVIVSKEGFTSGALALAKQKNISLVEMREPKDADWEGKIKTIHINLHLTSPEIYDLEFVQPPHQGGERIRAVVSGNDLTITEPAKQPEPLNRILSNSVASTTPENQTLEVRFPAGTTMQILGFDKSAILDAVRFKRRYHIHEEEIVIDGAQAIRLIVKEVFEGREFHVGYDGRITETTEPSEAEDYLL